MPDRVTKREETVGDSDIQIVQFIDLHRGGFRYSITGPGVPESARWKDFPNLEEAQRARAALQSVTKP